jgi:hypothetical protein
MDSTIGSSRGGRYRFADIVLESSRALPELRPADGDDPPAAVSLRWLDRVTAGEASAEWYHEWRDGPAVWARFGAMADGWLVEFPGMATFHITGGATRVDVAPAPSVPPFTVTHLLLNQVLPLVLSRRGRLVLHAGAVVIGGDITAFVGPTGSGKSTLVAACAAAGAAVVCDDSLIVERQDDGWLGVPSYPAVRLWESGLARVGWTESDRVAHYTDKRRVGLEHGDWRFAERPAPLRRLVLLAGEEPARPLAVELYAQVFRLDVRDQAEAIRLFHAVADLAGALEIVRLGPRERRDPVTMARRFVGPLRPPPGSGIVRPYG